MRARNRRVQKRDSRIRSSNSRRRLRSKDFVAKARRIITRRSPGQDFDAHEEWHEPTGAADYRVLVRDPGNGHRHVVTPEQIQTRLSQLPKRFLKGLEVVQLATMNRKKLRFPCYGLQWGCAIYLYPFDDSLEEHFCTPPPNALVIETKMYGGRWDQPEPNFWRLKWTESTARDFQLNNVLIHELGHMVDTWNTTYMGQERFAEWFAIEYGYRRTGGSEKRSRPSRKVRRRHHSS